MLTLENAFAVLHGNACAVGRMASLFYRFNNASDVQGMLKQIGTPASRITVQATNSTIDDESIAYGLVVSFHANNRHSELAALRLHHLMEQNICMTANVPDNLPTKETTRKIFDIFYSPKMS